jgi:hypothetical protein
LWPSDFSAVVAAVPINPELPEIRIFMCCVFSRFDNGIYPKVRGVSRQAVEEAIEYVPFARFKIRESRNGFAVRASM